MKIKHALILPVIALALVGCSTKAEEEIEVMSETKIVQTLEEVEMTQAFDEYKALREEKIRRANETRTEEVAIVDSVEGQLVTLSVTAYDLSYASCQKYPDHPQYGITASGKYVTEWHTVAASKSIPFGTRVYIPYFKDKPNAGIFEVEDRGGAIKEGKLDVYMVNRSDALAFGRRDLEVYILP